jgi:hypothetical protein
MLSLLWLRMDVAQQADESVFKIVHTSYTSINDLAVKGLAALIVADAKTPRDAAGFRKDYDGYLAALAPVAAIGEQLPTKALADALRQFAGQESTLAQAAGSYRRATTELMNWRERVAARRSQAAVARFPDVVATVRGALTPPFLVQGSDIQLTGYAPHLVQQVSVLKSKTLSAQQLAGLPGTGARPSISVPARRVYTRFPAVGAEVQTQLARLRADLQIGESVPPLTLAAAAAHWSAAQGWWMSGGGSVEQVYVESLAGRTATLPAVAAAMAPLPSLP